MLYYKEQAKARYTGVDLENANKRSRRNCRTSQPANQPPSPPSLTLPKATENSAVKTADHVFRKYKKGRIPVMFSQRMKTTKDVC